MASYTIDMLKSRAAEADEAAKKERVTDSSFSGSEQLVHGLEPM
jgi:hypothetical protein